MMEKSSLMLPCSAPSASTHVKQNKSRSPAQTVSQTRTPFPREKHRRSPRSSRPSRCRAGTLPPLRPRTLVGRLWSGLALESQSYARVLIARALISTCRLPGLPRTRQLPALAPPRLCSLQTPPETFPRRVSHSAS